MDEPGTAVPIPDLTGLVFGKWTVLGYSGRRNRNRMWLCRCACGVERRIREYYLVRNQTSRCQDCNRLKSRCAEIGDLTGRLFGAWFVVGYSHTDHRGARIWTCCCACGFESTIPTTSLVLGRSTCCRSCAAKKRAGRPGLAHDSAYLPTPDEIREACRQIRIGLGHVIAPDLR